MKLVIVESPSKAKTIQKYLGNGYKVLASSGHICDLPERTLGIDVDHDFQPEYVVSKDKVELLKKLKAAVKEAGEVYLATDPDREGEAISWHLSTNLGLTDEAQRIEFNEISPKAINKALSVPRKINMNLVNAQQARRVLDRLVGYKISPILSKKIKPNLSGGRVQSAALKMIVDREKEIRDFIPEEYWNIFALLTKKSKSTVFRAALADKNGGKLKVSNGEDAKSITDALNAATSWVVDKIKRGVSKTKPSPPFTTSTMQQDGSSRLSLTSPEIMKIAQQLYEGVEIEGEGHVALVTYIRTDSVRVSAEAQTEALNYIKEQFGADYAPQKPNFYTTKSQGVQDAHEAIRPISLERTPESMKNKLNRNQYKLYKLIYERFLASQMTDAVYNTLSVRIEAACADAKYGFKLTGRTVIFKGYTVIYDLPEKEEGEDEEDNSKLPDLKEGEELNLKELKSEQKFTKAPSRYTDATLVKAMEENGIGRPSTYSSVISILSKREYTQKEQKAIKPTTLGETVTAFMEKNFNEIVDTKFTAGVEAKLDTIEHGEKWSNVIADFYPPFIRNVNKAYSSEKKKVEEEVTDVKCDKCGSFMVVRTSRYGKFLACPRYPECKCIKNIIEPVGKCPYCGGDVVKKKTKAGKTFYGCSNYPKCDFMSWEIPAPHLCPTCKGIMKKSVKGDTVTYTCLNKNCEFTEQVKKDGNNDDN